MCMYFEESRKWFPFATCMTIFEPKPKLECVRKIYSEPQLLAMSVSTLYENWSNSGIFLAVTKLLLEHFCLSVRLSVSPSFLDLFSQCSPNRIIMKFSGIITIDKSDIHEKSQGQRPKVKVKDVKIYLHRFEHFQTVTPVWIHIWLRNDAQRLKWHRGGALLGVSRPWLHFEFAHGLKQCTKLDVA